MVPPKTPPFFSDVKGSRRRAKLMKCFRAFNLFNGFKALFRFTLGAKVLMRSSKTCLARYKTENQETCMASDEAKT